MLGRHPALRLELAKKGKRAPAKVREAERTKWTDGGPDGFNTVRLWKLVLLVEPEGEEPFEAKVDELLGIDWMVEPSERHYAFAVLYDPSDHRKVVIDRSDEGNRMLEDLQSRERTDAQTDRMRAQGQGALADRYQAAEELKMQYRRNEDPNLSADEREDRQQEMRRKMHEIMAGDSVQRAEQMRAIATDPSLSTEEKTAKMRELATGAGAAPNVLVGGQPVQTGGASAAAATADALAKLADLRDRGALTDAEFQEQKRKLLDE
jgi:hypothetical protein